MTSLQFLPVCAMVVAMAAPSLAGIIVVNESGGVGVYAFACNFNIGCDGGQGHDFAEVGTARAKVSGELKTIVQPNLVDIYGGAFVDELVIGSPNEIVNGSVTVTYRLEFEVLTTELWRVTDFFGPETEPPLETVALFLDLSSR